MISVTSLLLEQTLTMLLSIHAAEILLCLQHLVPTGQNDNTIEWLGLERTWKFIKFQLYSHGQNCHPLDEYIQLEAIMILAFLCWCSSIMLSASFRLLGSPPASIKPLMFWIQSIISFISKLNFCNWYEAASFSFLQHNVQFSIIQHRVV